jgi:hypothetical protein
VRIFYKEDYETAYFMKKQSAASETYGEGKRYITGFGGEV